MRNLLREQEVARLLREQEDDGILRIVSGQTKKVEKAKRMVNAVLSSETVDRYGDVIMAESFNTPKNFKNYFDGNPVLLWAHNRDCASPGLPIGTVKNPIFNGTDMNGNKSFEGDVHFNTDHQLAVDVGNMYCADEPSLQAFSVGFRPITVKHEPVKEGQTGYTFMEVDLLENSAVPIPANPAAMRKAFMSGEVTEEFLERTFFKMRDQVLVRNSDIFVPTSWRYKDSINELAILAADVRSGGLKPIERSVPVIPVKKLDDYKCANCDTSVKVYLADFPEKSYEGLPYHDVKCTNCSLTTTECIKAIEELQKLTALKK